MYQINLDQSSNRRERFENNIASLPEYISSTVNLRKRVSAITTTDDESFLRNGSFVLNGVELAEPGAEYRYGDHKKYTGHEVASFTSQGYYAGIL